MAVTLRKQIIRLAQENPEHRGALLPLLKEAVGQSSLQGAVTAALGGIVKEMGRFLKNKYKDSFTSFGKPYDAGYMKMGVDADIKNQVEPGRTGEISVHVSWDPKNYPTVRVWATYPKAKGYERDLIFKMDEAPGGIASRLGPSFQRDLDYWMTAVAKAYGEF